MIKIIVPTIKPVGMNQSHVPPNDLAKTKGVVI
jgi:hypothetical protein